MGRPGNSYGRDRPAIQRSGIGGGQSWRGGHGDSYGGTPPVFGGVSPGSGGHGSHGGSGQAFIDSCNDLRAKLSFSKFYSDH